MADDELTGVPAVVLAGGRGTRIAEVTGDRVPKALLPVAGRPFLAHQLDWLAAHGVDRVVLAVGFLADAIRAAVGTRWGDVAVTYSDEGDRRLGTGGALRRAVATLPGHDLAIALNGDTWFPIPLGELVAAHRRRRADLTLALAAAGDRERYGAVETGADGRVRGVAAKGAGGGGWINGGVYCLAPAVVTAMPERFSFEEDVLDARRRELAVFGVPFDVPFCDIGVPDAYRAFAEAAAS